jgi:hypothetical protein
MSTGKLLTSVSLARTLDTMSTHKNQLHSYMLVRNILKLPGCQERHNTTQKSTGKEKYTSAEGCTPESLGNKHPGQEAHRDISDTMLSLSCSWIGQVGFKVYAIG